MFPQRRIALVRIFVGLAFAVVILVGAAEFTRTVVHFKYKVHSAYLETVCPCKFY